MLRHVQAAVWLVVSVSRLVALVWAWTQAQLSARVSIFGVWMCSVAEAGLGCPVCVAVVNYRRSTTGTVIAQA